MAKKKKKKEPKKNFSYQVDLYGILYILIGILEFVDMDLVANLFVLFQLFYLIVYILSF